MHRLSVLLHGTPGSYLRHALQEGGAAAVACLLAPRGWASVSDIFFYSLLVDSTTFFATKTLCL
jgi:hypothetical protein